MLQTALLVINTFIINIANTEDPNSEYEKDYLLPVINLRHRDLNNK